MKVVALNGSPRPDGNTALVLKKMADVLEREGIEMEIIQTGVKPVRGCIACGRCKGSADSLCVFRDDPVNEAGLRLREADGFILAAPAYYSGIPGTMKCYLDRIFYPATPLFAHKVATAVAVARRTGALEVLHQLHNYLRLSRVMQPESQYWAVAYGREKGDVLKDEEGIQTAEKMAGSMAWMLRTHGESTRPHPPEEERRWTHFIR